MYIGQMADQNLPADPGIDHHIPDEQAVGGKTEGFLTVMGGKKGAFRWNVLHKTASFGWILPWHSAKVKVWIC